MPRRFVQIADVAETLDVSSRAVYALVKNGEIPAIKVNNQWRIETSEVEAYIERGYAATRATLRGVTLNDERP